MSTAPGAGDAAAMAAPGSDFYYASLYLPPASRRAVNAIEACRREISRIPQTCSDRGVAHVKLAWWREEIERLGANSPRHDVTRALAPLVAADGALKSAFVHLVDLTAAALSEPVLSSEDEVISAVRERYGAIYRALMRHSAGNETAAWSDVVELACLTEIAYELNAFRLHRQGGLLYLPATLLAAHGLHAEDVRHTIDGTRLRALLAQAMDSTAARMEVAERCLPRRLRRQHFLFTTLARITRRMLALTRDDGCRVLERRLELTPLHKLWIAWRVRSFG